MLGCLTSKSGNAANSVQTTLSLVLLSSKVKKRLAFSSANVFDVIINFAEMDVNKARPGHKWQKKTVEIKATYLEYQRPR